jgi:hypothetical protein
MTAPLTPESEEFIEDARLIGVLDGAMGSNEPYWRDSLAAIEAAAIARYAEGLVEVVARHLAADEGFTVTDEGWASHEAQWVRGWRQDARRLLALDAPEAHPYDDDHSVLATPEAPR